MNEAPEDEFDLVPRTVRWRLLSGLFRRTVLRRASGDSDGILLESRAARTRISYREALEISQERGLLGRRVVIRTAESLYKLGGLKTSDAAGFLETTRRRWLLEQWCMLDEWYESNRSTVEIVEPRANPSRYIRHSSIALHQERLSRSIVELSDRPTSNLGDHPLIEKLPVLRRFAAGDDSLIADANEAFVQEERRRCQQLFETIESNPLTEEQQVAVVTDEDRNLVVAAAGSGKTSVIVAKLAHLLHQGDLQPSQILILAFNRAARDELLQRLKTKVASPAIEEVSVMTFHGLGYSIIGQATGAMPSVAKHAGEPWKAAQIIREIVDDLCAEPEFERQVSEWFAWHLHQYKSAFDFQTLGEYFEYLKQNHIVTLKGESVKSYEECLIANFLTMKGVSYEYEARYEHDTADEAHRQYEPDFYLPEHNVYIEHFGIDRNGRTAPFVPRAQYHEDMEWKRALHEKYETDLIETFSYERREGILLSSLEKALTDREIELSDRASIEFLEELRDGSAYDRLSQLVALFLAHFISNGEDRSAVLERVGECGDAERANAFLSVFWPVCKRYRDRMKALKEVDFEMMIRDATQLVEAGRYAPPFKYILVDEFQDISVGRARLLKALCESSHGSQLFAVGDDWQSIYRFAGSDISVMQNFSEFFGPTARSDLSTTFRCNQEIADLSSKFITSNPEQLKKQVHGIGTRGSAAVYVFRYSTSAAPPITASLRRIEQEAPSASVLILGRYRRDRPENWSDLSSQTPGLALTFQTVHSSKGLEADYVVVVGMCAGMYGFPSEIEDDPLMELVLASQERFEHAEERRLFYVAITRAKHAVFLLAPEHGESSFVREIEDPKYATVSIGTEPAELPRCLACTSGVVSIREGQHGKFASCSNYPRCKSTNKVCPACADGLVSVVGELGSCSACATKFSTCPECSVGFLHSRRGKYGEFLGCSSYPECSYTRSADAK